MLYNTNIHTEFFIEACAYICVYSTMYFTLKRGWVPLLANKVLLEHRHTHLFRYCLFPFMLHSGVE